MTVRAQIPVTVANSLSEKDFQAQVIQYATLMGWRHFHPYEMRRSDPGWPDLILARPSTEELIAVELKAQKGVLSDAQRSWLEALNICGMEIRIWRPGDWGEIVERLKLPTGGHVMPRAP